MLHGIAGGLSAMHRTGIGHFDVKPANIILRDSQGTGSYSSKLSTLDMAAPVPVLVDFGLAGRKLRPGCGSPHYGAPEIWKNPPDPDLRPTPADTYAFSCLVFELLAGRQLFYGESLVEVIAAQLLHDGWPAQLLELRRHGGATASLAELLSHGLRRDPAQRPSLPDLRAALGRMGPQLRALTWPLGAR
jgi:serine/threonine protein kinase